ncbi:transglutaminase-like domain-containing protein [Chryseosolibacter indicus]|uniref:Transglutaminase domain-containing protein n=1 Tax=Chryseosolibacter indicus TaxID=2782351 RepID=A0ABS5VTJ8_9BACT|nr:transglutaminase domain-containing protein [Chryseosolibacter indicus]MBT1704732.1 transglutaminase domain-containing protein [Chryseosolibacter indicus]
MTPYILKSWILLIFIAISFNAISQKNKEKIASLRNSFKDDKVVATLMQTAYTFAIQRDELVVNEEEEISMISLEPNISGSREIYYHDNKEIISAKFVSGNTSTSSKSCGNYEVESVFYSDAKVCTYPFKFAYAGDEIIFKSTTRYNDPRYFTRVLFNDELGVKQRTIIFNVPLDANVEFVEKNFSGFNIKKATSESGKYKVVTYTVEDLKTSKNEENSLGILYYYPHIVVVTNDFAGKTGRKKIIGSTDDLYRWYAGIVKQVNNDPGALKAEVTRLTASAKTAEEKIKNIYYWVQDNIKYIAFEDGISGFRPEAAQTVLHNRYGDCKGMANLTKEMLKVAGFDARLTWIGTNRIPYTYELPSLAVDNHMICTVIFGEKQYILDPTEKFVALGKHGERIQGKEMLIENGEQFIVRKVPVADAEQNLIVRKEELQLEGDVLKGKGHISIEGEALKNILYISTNVQQDNKKKLFDNLVVSNFSNTDQVSVVNTPEVNRDKALELEYTYGLGNKVTSFDKDIYVEIDWTKSFKNFTIDADRISDYYFNRKIKNRTIKNLKIPAGYRISHLPASIKKVHNDFAFQLSFEQKGGVIIYTNEITVKQGLIKKSDFEAWNTIIKELTESYDDQIVLTKIN